MPVQTPLTPNKVLSDLIRYEVESRGMFTRKSARIKNTVGNSVTLTNPLGTPLKWVTDHYEIAVAGEEPAVVALLLECKPMDALANNATTTKLHPILVRGPAIIDKDQLPTADPVTSPGTYTQADLLAALESLQIIAHSEPPRSLSSDA